MGRSNELELLEQLLNSTAGGPISVVVAGEAGIGKTQLLNECVRRAQERGTRVVQGSCYPVGDAAPYAPILRIADQLPGDQADVLHRIARRAGASRGRHLGSAQDARSDRSRFLRETARALSKAATGPTWLCLEDLHWADAGTLLVINHLLDIRDSGARVICTVRVGEQADAAAASLLARIEQRSHVIDLQGLGEAELSEIVRAIVGFGQVGSRELQTLRTITRGNPLFLRELLLQLREGGLLERHSVAEAIALSRIPDRLTSVIDARLAMLSPETRRVLAGASVLGPEFDSAGLVTVLKEEREPVDGALDDAVTAGILRATNPPPLRKYEFAHPVFAKSIYDGIPTGERQRLHRVVADAAQSGRIALPVNELAYHHAIAFAGTGSARAIRYCRAAATEAERLLAYESAARFWELALKCYPRHPRQRARFRQRLGQALAAAGNWPKAIESWSEAVREWESLGETRIVSEIALAIGELHRWRQELDESAKWVSRALDSLPARSSGRTKGLALLGSIRCLHAPEEATRLLNDALESTRKRPIDPAVAFWAAQGLFALSRLEEARTLSARGFQRARGLGSADIAALLAGNLIIAELTLARPVQLDSYLEALETAPGDPSDTAALIQTLLCRALALQYRGSWRQVADICERWVADVRLASPFQVATARVIWAESQFALGDGQRAAVALTQALPDLGHMQPLAGLHLARVLTHIDANGEAAEIAGRYAEDVLGTPRLAGTRVLLGDVVASLDEPALWEQCYASVRDERRPMIVGYSVTSVRRVLGRLATRLKRWDEAAEYFESATAQLSKAKASWELAKTLGDYAAMRRARRRRGDDRKAALLEAQAAQLLDELGMAAGPAREERPGGMFDLTGRELEVLLLAAEGQRNREIADGLSLSERTVERHIANILGKIGADSRTEAVVKAVEAGVVAGRR